MGVRIAEHYTRGFGENHRIGIALPGGAEVELFCLEGEMNILGHVVRVEDEAVASVPALVEDFGVENIEGAEVGDYLLELHAPFHLRLSARKDFGILQAAQGFHQGSARKQYFALRPVVAGEGLAA